MKYLGYVIDRKGLHVDPDKVRAMLELQAPKNVTEVRRVVGTFSWYRRFIPEFSSVIAPITQLLRKSRKFIWSSDCEASFQQIKQCLVEAPVLSCPDYNLPFVVQTDASGYGIGAVLTQPYEDGDRVICYLSRSLSRQERNYSTVERECLAVLYAVEKLRPYLEGVPFTVVTDHYSLKWLHNLKEPSGRLARWAVRLQQYDFTIIHRKGKEHVVPDALSRSVPILDEVDVEEPDAAERSEDRWYRNMIEKIQEAPLKYKKWRLSGGKLYKYVKQDYPELSHGTESWKLVVPKSSRQHIISSVHDPPMCGHMGVYKTYSRLSDKYYWPKMRYDVANYIRKCHVCAAHKPSNRPPADMMVSHAKVDRPWEMISVDLMGPLPRSKKGNSFILVVTDYLSKFVLVFPLRTASTENVVKKIREDVFLIFGAARKVICDNGPQFRSKKFLEFAKEFKFECKYNANYHPRANPTERTNGTLKIMLSMYVQESHRTWDVNLPEIACAMRTAKHETTRLTPYFINFGKSMMLSGEDYKRDVILDIEDGSETTAETKNLVMRNILQDVRKRLEAAGSRSCARYNLRRRYEVFKPGEMVWKKNYTLSDASKYYSAKLAPKYVGPFYVHSKASPWTYTLRDRDGKELKGTWHIKDLKSAPAAEN